ncbi:MAG: glycoside hydrolase family 2 TIM barrel-domain containing protein [Bacteroidales bacterium]
MKKTALATLLLWSSILISAQVLEYEHILRYIENPSRVEENQLPSHVPFVPFETEEQAGSSEWERSPYYLSLNGSWRFNWASSPLNIPRDFHTSGFDASGWEEIQVPGTWQMQGFGYYIYRNVPMEFAPYDPPHVPVAFNPTGCYIREFEIPPSWDGRKVVLHFDGVKAGFWVWINGRYAGFDKGSMTPAEFDITDLLEQGPNKVAVQVVRWTDGSYLEDQDMWRFSGIYRRVYLVAHPRIHIRDFAVRTPLDENYSNATLEVDCYIQNETNGTEDGYSVTARLLGPAGEEVNVLKGTVDHLEPYGEQRISLSGGVRQPKLWSAEKPTLYTLLIMLKDRDGASAEVLEDKVGFRELEIRGGQMLVNGVPVTIKGVNRHEHDPLHGRTMSREVIEKDFQLMKELNINGIRTCHYPNDPLFYDLADEWGFYICDEVNAECHYGERWLAAQTGWEEAFMDRTIRYVQRDKNHPSVIMWSMGNECGLAPVHYQMAGYVRSADPTRFIYHQTNYPNGDAPFADVCGTRYPNPGMLDAIGDTTTRPVILGEYAHAVANSMGHFDQYWDRFYSYNSLQGGFIWDWVNQSLLVDLVTTRDRSPYQQQAVLMGRPERIEGIRGHAIQLSGLDDFVEVSPHPALNLTGHQLTLQTWIYPLEFNGSNPMISKGLHSFSLGQPQEDSIVFSLQTDHPYRLAAALPVNWYYNWHHVAAIYDGNEMSLYLDGEWLTGSPASGPVGRTYYEVTVGKNHEGDHENTPGPISNACFDEVMIHDVALLPEQLSYSQIEPALKEHLVLWLPFEESVNHGKFLCYGATPFTSATMDGVIFADRTYQPESWQVKHSHCPVKTVALDPAHGKFRIHNRYHFTNLNEIDIGWVMLKDGQVLREGDLEIDLPPLQKVDLIVPIDPEATAQRGEYLLRIEYRIRDRQRWAEAGYEIGFDEFEIFEVPGRPADQKEPAGSTEVKEAEGSPLVVMENEKELVVSGEDFSYEFDLARGMLKQIRFGTTEFLSRGPLLNVSRPPIVNEISTWTRAEYATWYAWGLDSLVHELESVVKERISDEEVLIRIRVNSYSFKERTLQFNNLFIYRINSQGTLLLDHQVTCQLELPARRASEDIPWFQKIGLEMKLDPGVEGFRWYGKGPFETYPDRKTGAKTAVYSMVADSIRMPYVISQGFDNHADVRWLEILTENGAGCRIEGGQPMNFSVDPYTNLEGSWYPYQLKRASNLTLNVDHRVSGVGGTPITVRHPYRTYPDEYRYHLVIQPIAY